jgi:hypothetical protein
MSGEGVITAAKNRVFERPSASMKSADLKRRTSGKATLCAFPARAGVEVSTMGSLLIHDCTLIDCTGRDPRAHAWVRVEGERIAGIGSGAPPGLMASSKSTRPDAC